MVAAGVLSLLLVAGCGRTGSQPEAETSGDPGSGPITEARLAAGTASGATWMAPDRMAAGQAGTFVLGVTVGPPGIAAGGGVWLEFPKAWFAALAPVAKPFREGPGKGYNRVVAAASRSGVEAVVALSRLDMRGRVSRFPADVHVEVRGGRLEPGDRVMVSLARTSAPFRAGADRVAVAIDALGDGGFRLLDESAPYEVLAGPVRRVELFAPSEAVAGRAVELQATAFDGYDNLASLAGARLEVAGLAAQPIALQVTPREPWRGRGVWVPAATGFFWPRLEGRLRGEAAALDAAGDPVRVLGEEPPARLLWGDLHTHSARSKDGIGRGDFLYGREATRLDFLATTEHAEDDGEPGHEIDQFTPEAWQRVRDEAAHATVPRRFAVLLGFECTLRRGHHCVIYRDLRGVPVTRRAARGLAGLWELLAPGPPALLVPHHTGRWTAAWPLVAAGPRVEDLTFPESQPHRGPAISWPEAPEVPRRVVEIFSGHGSSELYAPDDPLAYERVRYLPSASAPGPHYARDAWALGLHLGVVSGGDNHVGHPGLRHNGLTAVRAPEASREAIFDALAERHTYATTGERIYLDFELAGVAMGGEGLPPAGPVSGRVVAAAPGPIAFAEVVTLPVQGGEWTTAVRWEAPGRLLEAGFDLPAAPAVAYVRLELEEPIRGRVARAWSSPVWLAARPSSADPAPAAPKEAPE